MFLLGSENLLALAEPILYSESDSRNRQELRVPLIGDGYCVPRDGRGKWRFTAQFPINRLFTEECH